MIIRVAIPLVALSVLPSAISSAGHFTFIRNNSPVVLSADSEPIRVKRVLELFRHTGSDTLSPEVPTATGWNERARGTYVIVHFDEPTSILIRHERAITVTDLLINFDDTYPDHLLARNGDQFWAATKYAPESLAALACDPALDLIKLERFCDITRKELERREPAR